MSIFSTAFTSLGRIQEAGEVGLEYDIEFTSPNRGTDRIREQTDRPLYVFHGAYFSFPNRVPRVSLQKTLFFFLSVDEKLPESQNECQRAQPYRLSTHFTLLPAHRLPLLQFPASTAQCHKRPDPGRQLRPCKEHAGTCV